MPGTERSGRRTLIETSPDLELPELRPDFDSVCEYIAAVAGAMRDGKIDPRVGDSMLSAAREMRQVLKAKTGATKLDTMRDMLDAAKALQLEGLKREAEDRHRQA